MHIKLVAGLKGDRGPRGPVGDLTPELVAARDVAVDAAATSSTNAARTQDDRMATEADRSATSADRAQTAMDRESTVEDALQTQSDRLAVEAARAQTGQDRLAATSARDEALSYRDSASGHRAAAQAAATASQGNRDATAADRDVVANAAQSAREDVASTAADRVQTGQDREAARQSAAAAAMFDPSGFVRRDGSQGMTGRLDLSGGTIERAGINVPQRSADPTDGADGDVWSKASGLFYRIAGTVRQAYDAVSLPLPTQAQAEGGTLPAPGSWSPQRDKQAIDALAPRGNSTSGSQNTVTVGTSDTPLAAADFTATGPSVFAFLNAHMEGPGSKFAYVRIDLYRLSDGALIKTGVTAANLHTANSFERITVATEFTGLVRGVSYRLRGWGSTNTETVPMSSLITGICA